MNAKDLAEALRCCLEDDCENCPVQREICDTIDVEMAFVPVDLLEYIEEELADEQL